MWFFFNANFPLHANEMVDIHVTHLLGMQWEQMKRQTHANRNVSRGRDGAWTLVSYKTELDKA